MPLARATISIEKATLERFYRAVPAGRRSQVLQRLIERELEERRERLMSAAEAVENDPDFAAVREDEALWERATISDGLDEG